MIKRLLAGLFACFTALAQAQQIQFTSFNLESGLRQSQVYALCEDYLGYLWVGTQGGGVSRFDGTSFVHYGQPEGLPSNYVNAVFEDSQKRTWIGTTQGVCYFDGKQMKSCATPLMVNTIVETADHRVLLGTSNGVWEYHLSKNICEKRRLNATLDQAAIYVFLNEFQGEILMGTSAGMWKYGPHAQVVDMSTLHQLPAGAVHAITRQGKTIWLSVIGEGVFGINAPVPAIVSPQLTRVTALATDAGGVLWAGTQSEGLMHIVDGQVIRKITESEGLPHNGIRVLYKDHQERIWLGTSGGGFAYPGAKSFRRYDRSDGLPGTRIYALAEDTDGTIWISASQQGLAVVDSGGMHISEADSGFLEGVKCRSIATAPGQVWLGTEGRGMLLVTPGGRRLFNRENGMLPSDFVQKILCSPSGETWVATGEGLVLVAEAEPGVYTSKRYGTRDGMTGNSVSALEWDRDGNLWYGTYSGTVGCLKNGKVVAGFGAPQGISGTVTALAFTREHHCLAATKGNGIFHGSGQPGSVFQPLKYEGQSSQNFYLLSVDAAGYLWAGTENGVDRLMLNGSTVSQVQHFGKEAGFTGIETCQDAFLNDRAGRLWFGTMNGLMQYIPGQQQQQKKPPILHLEQANLFYKPIEETVYASVAHQLYDNNPTGLVLPWNENHLSFSFKGIDLTQGDQPMRYRWKLQGADNNWSPWTTQTQVNYASLAAGQYQLWVQASADGVVLSNTVQAFFTIKKPFWQEWPFQLGAFALLAAVLGVLVLMYIRRVRRTEAERRKKLEVQNHILQLEQKALQLQMNPHFIFNALNSIQSMIATRDYDIARQEINHFARLMRSILHNSRQQSISLKEETDTLQHYLTIEQSCQSNPFTFHITTDADMENLDIPPMLLQPFVENAVVHGVAPLTRPGLIEIHFALENDMIHCTIRDNGIGREKAAALKAAKKPGHQSAALQVTQERLAAMGGAVVFHDPPDGGTEVSVLVPVMY